MINSQRQVTDTNFTSDTLSVRNVPGSTKDEIMKYVTNSIEEGKSDDYKVLEIKTSTRKSEPYQGLK